MFVHETCNASIPTLYRAYTKVFRHCWSGMMFFITIYALDIFFSVHRVRQSLVIKRLTIKHFIHSFFVNNSTRNLTLHQIKTIFFIPHTYFVELEQNKTKKIK